MTLIPSNPQSPAGGVVPPPSVVPPARKASLNAIVVGIILFGLLLFFIDIAIIGVAVGPAGVLTAALLAILPAPIFLALALALDRLEPEPPWMLASAFFWGATVAAFFSGIFNTINGTIVAAFAGKAAGQAAMATISAPFVEEIAKGAVLLILWVWKKDEFDNVMDGIIYAAMVGLGFAMTENIQYYAQGLKGGGLVPTVILRGVFSPFAHPLFTSMTGMGLGLARQTNKPVLKYAAPVLGLGMAMLLHGIWNGAPTFLGGLGLLGMYFLIMVPLFIGMIVYANVLLRRDAEVLRQHLWADVQSGLLTQDEFETLTAPGARSRAARQALTSGGVEAWKARRRYHHVASELAFLRQRMAANPALRDAANVQQEAAFVEQLRTLRGGQPS
uniref:Integral membrane protein n=1 Tax=uncultured Armatimonadetes bacterium TaxID=157466 RepID=A0A6J4HDP5_9BACT|nr:FIG01170235: hypothetical protein [uncultured Armatimonadetes bacterium]